MTYRNNTKSHQACLCYIIIIPCGITVIISVINQWNILIYIQLLSYELQSLTIFRLCVVYTWSSSSAWELPGSARSLQQLQLPWTSLNPPTGFVVQSGIPNRIQTGWVREQSRLPDDGLLIYLAKERLVGGGSIFTISHLFFNNECGNKIYAINAIGVFHTSLRCYEAVWHTYFIWSHIACVSVYHNFHKPIVVLSHI